MKIRYIRAKNQINILKFNICPSSSLSVHFAWGLGAAFGIYLAKNTSGGHINPAVTLSKFITRSLPIR